MGSKHTGQCLCGQVSYIADGPPSIVAQCHCEECRRLSGTGHTVGAMFKADLVAISGDVRTFQYTSAKGSQVRKAFCGTCGSPVFGTNTQTPDHMTLTLGTMNDTDGLAVEAVIFARDHVRWDDLGPDVVRFGTQPDWTPDS
ncbi:GFA family protein [Octadecabacter antarcticus]|nr:GFA family protein [Octadecabacter antarcticus]